MNITSNQSQQHVVAQGNGDADNVEMGDQPSDNLIM